MLRAVAPLAVSIISSAAAGIGHIQPGAAGSAATPRGRWPAANSRSTAPLAVSITLILPDFSFGTYASGAANAGPHSGQQQAKSLHGVTSLANRR
jgi:hypothetical protein